MGRQYVRVIPRKDSIAEDIKKPTRHPVYQTTVYRRSPYTQRQRPRKPTLNQGPPNNTNPTADSTARYQTSPHSGISPAQALGLTCVFITCSGCDGLREGVAVPGLSDGVPIPDGLTAPLGGTGIEMSSGLPGTIEGGRSGILMRLATLL